MATTSLWRIKERLDHVLDYANDEEKTIDDVIDYAMNSSKTEEKKYVTCINCLQSNPYHSMTRTKELFHSTDGTLGYHGYQSFQIGEGNPELIHEIGVRTAKELWGDRFEVVVATHLDKGHLHNHFVINSVSFVDGKKYHHSNQDIYKFREVSDNLCKEYGLSIIENPKKYSKSRNQYNAAKSYIKEIKHDIDRAIRSSSYDGEFKTYMLFEGYEFKYIEGQYYIDHPNYSQLIPLKKLGADYQWNAIKEKLLNNRFPVIHYCDKEPTFKIKPYFEKYQKRELTGFQRTFIHWQYMLGILPRKIPPKQKLTPEAREELRKIRRISYETLLLCKYNITNIDELNAFRTQIQKEYDENIKLRKGCYKERLKVKDEDKRNELSKKAKSYTPKIQKIRYTLECLDEIEARSLRLDRQAKELGQAKIKSRGRER